jgi:hypothetical protein
VLLKKLRTRLRATRRYLAEPERKRKVLCRLMEALQEIGVLLAAFSPLDTALSEGGFKKNLGIFWVFLGLGCFVWILGVIGEAFVDDR